MARPLLCDSKTSNLIFNSLESLFAGETNKRRFLKKQRCLDTQKWTSYFFGSFYESKRVIDVQPSQQTHVSRYYTANEQLVYNKLAT
jgi:hypothetical protein